MNFWNLPGYEHYNYASEGPHTSQVDQTSDVLAGQSGASSSSYTPYSGDSYTRPPGENDVLPTLRLFPGDYPLEHEIAAPESLQGETSVARSVHGDMPIPQSVQGEIPARQLVQGEIPARQLVQGEAPIPELIDRFGGIGLPALDLVKHLDHHEVLPVHALIRLLQSYYPSRDTLGQKLHSLNRLLEGRDHGHQIGHLMPVEQGPRPSAYHLNEVRGFLSLKGSTPLAMV